MSRLVKLILKIVLILIICFVIIIGTLFIFLDADTVGSKVTHSIEQRTGYKINLQGKLAWTLYPGLGITIPALSVTPPKQTLPMLQLQDVILTIPLTFNLNKHVDAKVLVKSATIMNVQTQQAVINIAWTENALTLKSLASNLYNGKLLAQGQCIGLPLAPVCTLTTQGKNIQMQPLLADLSSTHKKLQLSGLGQFDLKLTTAGKTKAELTRHLNGNGDLTINEGKVYGIDLDFIIRNADALFNGTQFVASNNLKITNFTELTTRFALRNGIATTSKLALASNTLGLNGNVNLDLNNTGINADLTIKPSAEIKTQYSLPVSIKGTLAEPKIHVDMNFIKKNAIKSLLNNLSSRLLH